MSIKNIIITGSINAYPTQSYGQKMYISSTDEQSFPIEVAVGGNAGSPPDLLGQTSSIDLFVNINQSWSGSNPTPVGDVAFIHNTQDEFVNGEYSGSNLVVQDQRLIDEDCLEFLTVNPTLVNYKPYFYSTNVVPLGTFLDPKTSPNAGEIYILFRYYLDPGDIALPVDPGPGGA